MAITVSKMANEFVIHVPDEYDYRYAHPDRYKPQMVLQCHRRDKIVELISKLYQDLNGNQIQIYYREELNLDKYTTKKGDKKKGIVRKLDEGEDEKDDVHFFYNHQL